MMPPAGLRWRHIILNTHGSWLPGDARGFRNRGHRIQSSGDYRNPPPAHEHAGLRARNVGSCAAPTILPRTALGAIGEAIVENLLSQRVRVAAVSVNPTHVHALVELSDNVEAIRKTCGWYKFFATRAARENCPELSDVEIWADGEAYKPVDSRRH